MVMIPLYTPGWRVPGLMVAVRIAGVLLLEELTVSHGPSATVAKVNATEGPLVVTATDWGETGVLLPF